MSIPHHSTASSRLPSLLKTLSSRTNIADELGLTPSAVTQLAATLPAAEVTDAEREMDNQYDRIEKKLLDQLERTTPMLLRPMEISKVLQTINTAKRRGSILANQDEPKKVVTLNLPTVIQNRFVLNQFNQVVSAGAQDLVTLPSQLVEKLASAPTLVGESNVSTESISATEDEFGV